MRLPRILAIAVTSAALLLPVSTLPSVSADAAMKPHRTITAKVVKAHATLHLHAHVADYPRGHTFLEKRNCARCDWHVVAKRDTSRIGRVAYPLGAPRKGRWYYRMGTPQTHDYARSYSRRFYTYR